jgi:hypothetical protein
MFARMRSSRGANLFVEILMIVVGINIALWFEGLAEDYRDAETGRQYLHGLYDDLAVDVHSLDLNTKLIEAKLEKLKTITPALSTLMELPAEVQAETLFTPSSYYFFQPADFTYTAMRESGDFRLLEDPDIKRRMLRLVRQYRFINELQDNFIQAMDTEYIPTMMRGFDLASGRITDPLLVKDQVFLNFFPHTLEDAGNRLKVLNQARVQASELMQAIEDQLDR